jgi:hypothetical protein
MTDPVDKLIAQLQEDLNRVETDRANSTGPCTTCRFARYDSLMRGYPSWHFCTHPAVARPSYNPSTGNVDQYEVRQSDARREGGPCGPTGTLHTPPDPPAKRVVSWFGRLFGAGEYQ